nr:GNAT family N-acyltransferase [Marinicella sp. W31]MDC2876427.1 GNAT family N-acetyltransferase [Marinicella sp. W31]
MRYRVFVDEMQARLPAEAMRSKRDFDQWDAMCDHLLVLDTKLDGDVEDQIVATYRLLRHEVAMEHGGFYSDSEYQTDRLVARHPDVRFMELGRSCVLPDYRSKRTVELLWQGNWSYALKHNIGVMFGCASFHGTDSAEHAMALSFLYHNARATGEWAVKARPELAVDMNLMSAEEVSGRRALTGLPPLIKGYLRLGAMVGEGPWSTTPSIPPMCWWFCRLRRFPTATSITTAPTLAVSQADRFGGLLCNSVTIKTVLPSFLLPGSFGRSDFVRHGKTTEAPRASPAKHFRR